MGDPDRKPLPPYLPFKTFLNAIESWRVVLPNQIDRDVLGSYAGTMQSWVLSTLKFFNLTDQDGHPTESLKALTIASETERVPLLASMARRYYPFLFATGFDLSRTTPNQLKEKFEATGAKGETVVKAISFFSGLAKAAGIPMSPFVTVRTRGPRKSKSAKPAKKDEQGGVVLGTPTVIHQQKSDMDFLVGILDPAVMEDAEQQAVWTLIRYVKTRDAAK